MEKIKGRKPYINFQHDQTDCGVACLQSIVNYYGGSIGLEVLRERSGTNTQGTTLLGLWQAAQESGFTAEGCQADITSLREHGKPTILHIELPNRLQHYVIYFGEKKGKALVGDPDKGMETIRFEDLDLLWKSKKCLTLEPNEIFENLKKLGNEKKTWLKQLIIDDMQLLVGSKNLITTDKKALFKLLVAASFVFFIPFLVKIIWFLGFTTSYTMEQADTFRFLSLYQLLADVDGFEGLSFLLKFTNVFQLLYFLLVSYGIARYTTKSFGQSAAVFFLIYVLPNLAYAVLIYVVKSKAF